jgi:hypothetical protein
VNGCEDIKAEIVSEAARGSDGLGYHDLLGADAEDERAIKAEGTLMIDGGKYERLRGRKSRCRKFENVNANHQ